MSRMNFLRIAVGVLAVMTTASSYKQATSNSMAGPLTILSPESDSKIGEDDIVNVGYSYATPGTRTITCTLAGLTSPPQTVTNQSGARGFPFTGIPAGSGYTAVASDGTNTAEATGLEQPG